MITTIFNASSSTTTFIYKPQTIVENIQLIHFCEDYLFQNEFLSFYNIN